MFEDKNSVTTFFEIRKIHITRDTIIDISRNCYKHYMVQCVITNDYFTENKVLTSFTLLKIIRGIISIVITKLSLYEIIN